MQPRNLYFWQLKIWRFDGRDRGDLLQMQWNYAKIFKFAVITYN